MQIIYFADDDLGPRKAECIPQGHMDESKKGLRPEGSFWFLPGALSTHFLLKVLTLCTLISPRTPVREEFLFFFLFQLPFLFSRLKI